MTPDIAVKIAFVLAFVVSAASATAAARRAAAHHGTVINQLHHEVRWLVVARGALGLVFYAALIAWLFNVPGTGWARVDVPWPFRWAGVALLAASVALLASSYRALGTNYRGGVGLFDGHELITNGPYRVVRHPIYLSFTLIMIGVTAMSANWLLGLSGLILVVMIAVGRLPREERELHGRFAARWTQYRDRTGAFTPRSGG